MSKEVTVLRAFEDASLDELINALSAADDHYHNTGEPLLDDNEYDIAKRAAYAIDPAHVYFTGVGSSVRGGKIRLPFQMGSLNQVYEGESTDWIAKNDLANHYIVLTDKLDGTSAMLTYDDKGNLQIAYSRGNGLEGADITRHIKNFPTVVTSHPELRNVTIRGEVIIQQDRFEAARSLKTRRGGGEYKNPRNMVAGQMNSKTLPAEIYEYLDFVTYEIVGATDHKVDQLAFLEEVGFLTPFAQVIPAKLFNDKWLTKHLNERRDVSVYEIDGLVAEVNDKTKRASMNPTSSTLNPAYAVKYKIASADNEKNVRVVEVEWNVSKHGYQKPRVRIEPTELMGVTVQHATGFNAKFIKENSIGKGAIIRITRSGDVIPFILEVIEPGELDLPEGEWNETGVDLVATSGEAAETAYFKQVVSFFESIDAPYLKSGSISKMFAEGYTTVESLIQADELEYIVVIGKNGTKVHEGLTKRLNNMYFHDFIGSTSFFGRGVGKRKFKKLLDVYDYWDLSDLTVSDIAGVEGFNDKTAAKIVDGMSSFDEFYNKVKDYITIVEPKVTGVTMKDQNIVFTGFRDKALQAEVEANGGRVASGVSKKTDLVVAANPDSNSGKVKKARQYGIDVIGVDEFRQML